MAELLLEIFSEEMPARMQNQAVINLSNLFDEQAKKSGMISSFIYPTVTPSVDTHCLTTFKTIFFISSSGF